jgi:hypothetical protein
MCLLHVASMRLLVTEGIGTLVIKMLTYKAKLASMRVIEQEEAYTSVRRKVASNEWVNNPRLGSNRTPLPGASLVRVRY